MTASLKPSKTRRAQAERSETMQRRLLDAAVAVLKRRGLAGFRTAEVVAMAGVSKGALLHHFPTKVSLIAAAFEWLREGTDESARYFHTRETLVDVIGDLIAESRTFFSGESFPVSLDVAISAARTPELRDAIFRSEEHTSELQSLMRISYAVFCLKKKKKQPIIDSKQ